MSAESAVSAARSRQNGRETQELTARTADRHALYQLSVQSPEADIRFLDRVFKKSFGRRAELLREDFCGTALLSCEWVNKRPTNRAIGIDLDESVLDWGRRHNLAPLGEKAKRIRLIHENVLHADTEKVDMIASMNFSYFIFRERPLMLEYFRAVRRALRRQGLFVMDLMGGPEAQIVQTEEREIEGDDGEEFTYVWDQHEFNPITHRVLNYIHFRFEDGSEMKRAFEYEWRLWTVVELRDMLEEVGFRKVDVYWEGSDADGEPNGVYRLSRKGDDAPAWLAYVVATP